MDARENFQACQAQLLKRMGVVAESRFVEIAAVSGPVHVLTAGEGPPVVMVPGFGDPAAMWAPLMARLQGFTLFAVDRPCFGLTGSARHTTATIRTLAVEFLEQVIAALGVERPVFVSNSMGSLWSIWLALDRPAKVAAMTHIGCPAFILGTSAPLPMRLISNPVLGPLLMRLMPPSPKQVMKLAAMAGEDLSAFPEMRDLLVSMQELAGVQPALRELLAAVVRLRGARPQVALTAEQLAQITQPVQLIWGERDPFGAVAIGEQAAATIPRAEFHVVSEAGHIPWLAHASDVGKLATPFLRRHSAAAGEAGDRGSTPRRSPPESPAPGSPLLG